MMETTLSTQFSRSTRWDTRRANVVLLLGTFSATDDESRTNLILPIRRSIYGHHDFLGTGATSLAEEVRTICPLPVLPSSLTVPHRRSSSTPSDCLSTRLRLSSSPISISTTTRSWSLWKSYSRRTKTWTMERSPRSLSSAATFAVGLSCSTARQRGNTKVRSMTPTMR